MSEKYAVIRISGHQYLVREGDVLDITTTKVVEGEEPVKVEAEVLLVNDDGKIEVGTPTVAGVKVEFEIENEFNDKIHVRRYKSKSRYRRKKGFKYPMQRIKIVSIGSAKSSVSKSKPKVEKVEKVEKASTKATASKKETK